MAAVSTYYGATAIDVVGFKATKGWTADYSHGSVSQDKSKSDSKSGTQAKSSRFRCSRNEKTPNASEIDTVAAKEELKERRPQKKNSVEGFRPDKVDYQANVRSPHMRQDAESVESHGSTRKIITKQVDYTVDF